MLEHHADLAAHVAQIARRPSGRRVPSGASAIADQPALDADLAGIVALDES